MQKIIAFSLALMLMNSTATMQISQHAHQPDIKSPITSNTISICQLALGTSVICVTLDVGTMVKDHIQRQRLAQKNSRGEQLHAACKLDCFDQAEALLQEDTDINHQTQDGDTALMSAVFENKEEAVTFLLGHGADCLVQNKAGLCAYDFAVGKSSPNQNILKLLKDKATQIAWDEILLHKETEKLKAALKAGADHNIRKNLNSSMLMMAVERYHIDQARLLILAGADLEAKDAWGNTVYNVLAGISSGFTAMQDAINQAIKEREELQKIVEAKTVASGISAKKKE